MILTCFAGCNKYITEVIHMTYKESFIKFMVDCGVLTFGEFTLKSEERLLTL